MNKKYSRSLGRAHGIELFRVQLNKCAVKRSVASCKYPVSSGSPSGRISRPSHQVLWIQGVVPVRLCALRGAGSRAFAFADLFRSEAATADGAAPTRRRNRCHTWDLLSAGTVGSHQFATAFRTLSLNHGLTRAKRFRVVILES